MRSAQCAVRSIFFMPWPQVYDPLHNPFASTLVAALPIVILLGSLALLRLSARSAAGLGLVTALVVAIGVVGMPAGLAVRAALLGAAYGLFPIGWIILNVIFLYQLTYEHRRTRARPAAAAAARRL
jgi:lactate permease